MSEDILTAVFNNTEILTCPLFDTISYEIKDESGTFSGYNKAGQPNISLKTPPYDLKIGDTITFYVICHALPSSFIETHIVDSISVIPVQYFVGLHDNLAHDYTEVMGAYILQINDFSLTGTFKSEDTLTGVIPI